MCKYIYNTIQGHYPSIQHVYIALNPDYEKSVKLAM